MIIQQSLTIVLLLFFTVALTGCSRSPRATFYTLGAAPKAAPADPSKKAPSVFIANLTLPDMVDRPQLVELVNGNRVEILEMHRWAEPLKNGISRLLVENLAGQLGSDMVTAHPQNSAINPDYRVFVDVQRFESTGNNIVVDANWSIRRMPSGQHKSGRSQARESRKGEGYESLVAAYNLAIVTVGNDIAQAIRTEWAVAN